MRAIHLAWISFILPLAAFAQGPLAPTAAPAPGMKTLAQVEPRTIITGATFTITQPGSYYLATNILYGGSSGSGIVIATNDVTIDLNGFTLATTNSSSAGIDAGASVRNIVIRNGTIRDWGYIGIDLGGSDNCLFEDLLVISNGYRGIQAGYNSRVERCSFVGNDDIGFFGFGPNVIVDSSAFRNSRSGFYLVQASTAQRCVAELNRDSGFEAFSGCVLVDCVAFINLTNGFTVDSGVKLSDCSATENYRDGIFADEGCHIERCTTYMNRRNGITVSNDNFVLENHCSTNGPFSTGAGIHVLGRANRIDGNVVNYNDYGIQVAGISNLIMRNSAQGNTSSNYFIAGTNSVAGIAIVGGSGFTNTNPWVNFEL